MKIILILLATYSVLFATNDYKCTIEEIRFLETSSYDLKKYQKVYINKEFIVNRKTGIMTGVIKNYYLNKPTIIDSGSTENSFKVSTLLKKGEGLGSGSVISSLIIKEWDKNRKKPFIYMNNHDLFFGHCTYF